MGIAIKGIVVSGKHDAGPLVTLPWVKEQISQKLGFQPYPGTLNLRLSKESQELLRNALSGIQVYAVEPAQEGYARALCYRILITKRLYGALIFPQIPGRSEEIIEVISQRYLREALNLKDGDELIFEVV
jgi:riboflavin kinase